MVEKVLKLYCDTNFQLFTILNRDEDLFYKYRKIVFGDKRDYKRMLYDIIPTYLVKITSNNDNKNRLFYLEISVAMLRYNLDTIIEHKIIKTFNNFDDMMDYLNEKFLNNVFNLHQLNNKIRQEKLDKLNNY